MPDCKPPSDSSISNPETAIGHPFDAAVFLAPPGWVARTSAADREWATTLAHHVPVFVVQADLSGNRFRLTSGGADGVKLLQVGNGQGLPQFRTLCQAFQAQHVQAPLLVLADSAFLEFAAACYAPLKVWHAGAASRPAWPPAETGLQKLRAVLESMDAAVVASGEGAALIRELAGWSGPVLTGSGAGLASSILGFRWPIEPPGAAAQSAIENPKSKICGPPAAASPLKVLVLYDPYSTHVSTITEHLESLHQFSRHRVCYLPAVQDRPCPADLCAYDAVLIHYSVRLSARQHLSTALAQGVSEYRGFKALFAQDEYENTESLRTGLEQLGIHALFTCVPLEEVEKVYPRTRFPRLEFVPTLAGFVPRRLEGAPCWKPLAQRRWLIGYRGRELGFWYGRLGQEKAEIGRRMRALCEARGLPVSIEWTEERRIYGPAWYEFLADCRATLGTESGANIFDWDESLKAVVETQLRRRPQTSFAEVFERHLKTREGEVTMNQISPKAFEAIALGTALVLFEGRYSGVLQPGRHYLPLKRDFSNADEVLARLHDEEYLGALTRRAYEEIIQPGKYSYRAFVRSLDEFLDQRIRKPNLWEPVTAVAGWRRRAGLPGEAQTAPGFSPSPDELLGLETCGEVLHPRYSPTPPQLTCCGRRIPPSVNRMLIRLWERLPGFVRRATRPILLKRLGW